MNIFSDKNLWKYAELINQLILPCNTIYKVIPGLQAPIHEKDCHIPKPDHSANAYFQFNVIDTAKNELASYCYCEYYEKYQLIDIAMCCTAVPHRRKFLSVLVRLPIIILAIDNPDKVEMIASSTTSFDLDKPVRSQPLLVNKLNFYAKVEDELAPPGAPAMYVPAENVSPEYDRKLEKYGNDKDFLRWQTLKWKMYNTFLYTKGYTVKDFPRIERTIEEIKGCERFK